MMRSSLNRISIRRQLAGLAILVAIPLIGAMAYGGFTARENAGVSAEQTSSQLASVTASSVEGIISDARAQLASTANRPLTRLMDPTRCDPFLQEHLRVSHYAINLTTANLGGRIVCSALPEPSGGLPSVADSEWFLRVRRTGTFTVGEPYVGRISRRRVAVLTLPIEDRGRRVGYLNLAIDLVHIQKHFSRLAQSSKSLLAVITESGQIVARSRDAGRYVGTRVPPEVLSRLRGPPSIAVGIDGVERVYARAPVGGTTWIVSAGMPTSIAYGASNRLLGTLLVVSLLLLLLALIAAVMTGGAIARPIQLLAGRARDIAVGNSAAVMPLQGPPEVVLAAQQLDQAVASLRKSAEELRQSQKMDAVGQLAGGIAHDFNNLLTVISFYSEFALSRLDGSDPELRSYIEEIARAGETAAQLTRQLLAVSRRQTLQPTVFDLNEVVSDSETLLRRLLGSHIDILSSFAPYPCPVTADRGQIEQILMNLAVNARDAMPGGGTLAIETETIQLDADEARQFGASAGNHVLLRMSDTGCGMDPDTQAHAFDPFFTTKPVGEGTGLGLATVYGSVRQSGGSLTLSSKPGEGTTFEILLPLATGAIAPPAASTTPVHVSGTERILLVEDEEIVRNLVKAILLGKGYDVLVASDGDEAIRQSRTEPFDLLLTDMVMPNMSGKELAVNLRRTNPGLPVVYMSGYARDVASDDEMDSADAFIQKPFASHTLAATIRAVLDSRQPPTTRQPLP